MKPFNTSESGYTETAGTIVLAPNDRVDMSVWGNPERKKANYGVIAANLFFYRTRGASK